jgi:hypothetical protein
VIGLKATGETATGNTIQRIGTGDTNTKTDWTVAAASWGLPNSGQ